MRPARLRTGLPAVLSALGGQAAVAAQLGLKRPSGGMWVSRGAVPPEHHLALWRLCLERGVAWEPPGAAELLPALAAAFGVRPESTPSPEAT